MLEKFLEFDVETINYYAKNQYKLIKKDSKYALMQINHEFYRDTLVTDFITAEELCEMLRTMMLILGFEHD